jgi:class 3 adenylate cyclase
MTAEQQPSRVGRRLAAIVAADVPGYSRLMGLDEVGTARALREHRKVTDALVEKHGGRLVKSPGMFVISCSLAEIRFLTFGPRRRASSRLACDPWLCKNAKDRNTARITFFSFASGFPSWSPKRGR